MKQFHPSAVSVQACLWGIILFVTGAGQASWAAQSVENSAPALLSASVSSTTNAPDITPPSVPKNLQILAISPRKVFLGWEASTNGSAPVTYTLQRDGLLLQEGLSSTNYLDLQVQPGQSYAYAVQAVDAAGNKSPFTPELTAQTPAEQLVDTPGLLFEAWKDINPPDFDTFLNDPRFLADTPDYRALATAADTLTVFTDETHDNYGGRLSGFLVPQTTGKYELFLRSQDASQLWLSPDDQDANLVRIAEETTCCAPFQESGDPRTSAPITLVSGRRYAIQVLWVAGTGPDYAQVAWRNVDDPIPAGALYPALSDFLRTPWDPSGGPPTVTNKSVVFPVVGTNATLQVQAIGELPITYEWSLLGGNAIPGATNSSLVITNVALTNLGAIYSVRLQNTFGSVSANLALFPDGTLFVEAEDFNFGQGDYVKNQPIGTTGAYPGGSYFDQGTALDNSFDYFTTATATNDYRVGTPVSIGQLGRDTGSLTRGQFDVQINRAVTVAPAGDWFNYTRAFPSPAGDYYVFSRFASAESPVHAQLDEVTSGGASTNVVLQKLGEFRPGRATGGTNRFEPFPLVNSAGDLVTLTNWVGERTLRLTVLPANSPGFDYLFLVPTTARSTAPVEFTSVTRVGNNLVLTWSAGILESGPTVVGPWTPLPNATSPATFPLTGPLMFYRLR